MRVSVLLAQRSHHRRQKGSLWTVNACCSVWLICESVTPGRASRVHQRFGRMPGTCAGESDSPAAAFKGRRYSKKDKDGIETPSHLAGETQRVRSRGEVCGPESALHNLPGPANRCLHRAGRCPGPRGRHLSSHQRLAKQCCWSTEILPRRWQLEWRACAPPARH